MDQYSNNNPVGIARFGYFYCFILDEFHVEESGMSRDSVQVYRFPRSQKQTLAWPISRLVLLRSPQHAEEMFLLWNNNEQNRRNNFKHIYPI